MTEPRTEKMPGMDMNSLIARAEEIIGEEAIWVICGMRAHDRWELDPISTTDPIVERITAFNVLEKAVDEFLCQHPVSLVVKERIRSYILD